MARRAARRRTTAAILAALALGSTAGCSTTAPSGPTATVVVRIHAEDRPSYDVRLTRASGRLAAARTMRPGESRSFTVPAGWLTVRVPGLCVVPTPNTGTTTIDVDRDDCSVVPSRA